MASSSAALPGHLSVVTAIPEWHIITSEYPPQPGGVSDYTRMVATRLAEEGDRVHVWCPLSPGLEVSMRGVNVHRALGRMSLHDLLRAGRRLNRLRKRRRLLV